MFIIEVELLSKEWDTAKNKELGLDPNKLVVGSNKYAFWKCSECGYEWKAQIAKRGIRGQGCPVCAKSKIRVINKNRIREKIEKDGSLGDLFPELLSEWDFDKNELTPFDYLPMSNSSVYWACSVCGYNWKGVISNRVKGAGCKICGKNKGKRTLLSNLIGEKGSLADNAPKIASEWDYEKNGELSPNEVMQNTNKSVWWKCKDCGYSWKTTISNRTLGRGCPKCGFIKQGISNAKPITGVNDLLSQAPELAMELHPTKNGNLLASELARFSNKKVWWLGKCGHEWQATVGSRYSGRGCPHCQKEFKISYPEKAIFFYLKKYLSLSVKENYRPAWLGGKEIDIFLPDLSFGIEYDGSNWHKDVKSDEAKNVLCKENGVDLLRIRENGAPSINHSNTYCISTSSEKDTELQHAIEYVFSYLYSHYGVLVEYSIDLPNDRAQIYEIMEMSRKENSLAVLYPDISKEWHTAKNGAITPEYVNAHTHRKFWWICPKGHEYEMTVKHRTEKNTQCPICSSHRVLDGYNDLKTKRPDVAARWDYEKNNGLLPTQVMEFSNTKVWWKCEKGHSYERLISHETTRDVGCPICKMQKLSPGVNDLVTLFPNIAEEWDYESNGNEKPEEYTPISHRRVNWKCKKCGRKWDISINSRCILGHGCPNCAGAKRWASRKEKHPHSAESVPD